MGRQKYFKMVIKLCLSDSKLNLQLIHVQSLIDLLVISKFVPQSILEKTLYSLKIKDRNRLISLDNFDGQLERDSQGIPYWNVYLQTSALTTSRSIAKSISKELFDTTNQIDPSIQLCPLNQFQECYREKLFSIPRSPFFPGFFSWVTLKHLDLSQTDQVKETPERYQKVFILENKYLLDPEKLEINKFIFRKALLLRKIEPKAIAIAIFLLSHPNIVQKMIAKNKENENDFFNKSENK